MLGVLKGVLYKNYVEYKQLNWLERLKVSTKNETVNLFPSTHLILPPSMRKFANKEGKISMKRGMNLEQHEIVIRGEEKQIQQ